MTYMDDEISIYKIPMKESTNGLLGSYVDENMLNRDLYLEFFINCTKESLELKPVKL